MLLPREAKVDYLLHCEAVKQAIAAGGAYLLLAAPARGMRGIP